MTSTVEDTTATGTSFVIEGGYPLNGTVTPAGNKNAALPIIAAAVLASEPVTLHNVPDIVDVRNLLKILAGAGVRVDRLGPNSYEIHAGDDTDPTSVDADLCARIRASILIAGPMLARFGEVTIPPPGGDVIGRRRVDTHMHALEALGARIDGTRSYRFEAPRGLIGCELFLDEPSVTGTENAISAAVLATGKTVIENAACEPHVQDLCHFLVSCGAKISGIGSNILHIEGVDKLGGCEYHIQPDHIEIGSFIGLAAVTGGEMVIENAPLWQMRPIRLGFEKLGVNLEFDGRDVRVPREQRLAVQDDMGSQIAKIEDGPWPQFPADLTSIAVAVATQSSGTIMVFEKMFENRLVFTDKLVAMGARIVLCDPHRAVISGPARLRAQPLESPDIRAGMAMLIAALSADGTSRIGNIRQIDRGYERIDERLKALGARIERV